MMNEPSECSSCGGRFSGPHFCPGPEEGLPDWLFEQPTSDLPAHEALGVKLVWTALMMLPEHHDAALFVAGIYCAEFDLDVDEIKRVVTGAVNPKQLDVMLDAWKSRGGKR